MKKPLPSDKGNRAVREFWDRRPLFDKELAPRDLVQYFREIEQLKREEVEPFSFGFWEFDAHPGEEVLDVGCGPGWLSVQYARAGARVTSVDLSSVSLERCRSYFKHEGLEGKFVHSDCGRLPFRDATFDFVSASGVLHHTPDPRKGAQEVFRVLKPGGRAAITLYYRNLMLAPWAFPLTLGLVRLLGVRKPDACFGKASDLTEFGALYDGQENPYGRIYSRREARELFKEFAYDPETDIEVHYFPRRFLPFGRWIRGPLFRLLDRTLGLMIYFKLTKPATAGQGGSK